MNLPEGWHEVELKNLLTLDQIKQVWLIMETGADSLERIRKLKALFHSLSPQLEDKGVLPDYLAYVIESIYEHTTKPDWSDN